MRRWTVTAIEPSRDDRERVRHIKKPNWFKNFEITWGTEMPGHSLESSLQIINYKIIPTVLEPPEGTAKAV